MVLLTFLLKSRISSTSVIPAFVSCISCIAALSRAAHCTHIAVALHACPAAVLLPVAAVASFCPLAAVITVLPSVRRTVTAVLPSVRCTVIAVIFFAAFYTICTFRRMVCFFRAFLCFCALCLWYWRLYNLVIWHMCRSTVVVWPVCVWADRNMRAFRRTDGTLPALPVCALAGLFVPVSILLAVLFAVLCVKYRGNTRFFLWPCLALL